MFKSQAETVWAEPRRRRLVLLWLPIPLMGRVFVRPTGWPHAAGVVHSHHLTRKEAENTLLLIIEACVERLAGVGDLLQRPPNFSKVVSDGVEPIERRRAPALAH